MKLFLIISILFLSSQHFINEVCGHSNTDRLVRSLLSDYLPLADPGNITLNIGLALVDLEFDSESDVLSASVWERYKWTDDRLSWNATDYDGMTSLRLPDEQLWTPDIMLYNVYKGEHKRSPVNAVITSNGEIMWIPPSVMKVRCSRDQEIGDNIEAMDDKDIITCPIKMGSWTYDGFRVNLTSSYNNADQIQYDNNNNNRVIVVSADTLINSVVYACCPEPYVSYELALKIKIRK